MHGSRIWVVGLVDGVFVCEARGRSRAIVHADFIGTFTSLSKANFHSFCLYQSILTRTEAWLTVVLSVNLELIRKKISVSDG